MSCISCLFNKAYRTYGINLNNIVHEILDCIGLAAGEKQLELIKMRIDIINQTRLATTTPPYTQ